MIKFDIDKMYCGQIERGDVFLSNYQGEEKKVVVLQDNVLNSSLPTVICAVIEKNDSEVFPNEVLLKAKEIGADSDAICMLHKVIMVERVNMFIKCGELSADKLKDVYQALDINLGRFRD